MVGDRLSNVSLMKLASVTLASSDEVGNRMGWLKLNDPFTISSAYSLYTARHPAKLPWHGWRSIWRMQLQQWVKAFIWNLAHDKILTNNGWWRRKMTDTLACSRCSQIVEDTLHTIKDCPASKNVWLKMGMMHFIPNFFVLPLQEWVLRCLTWRRSNLEEDKWPERLAIAMWNQWMWRNAEVFRKGTTSLQQRLDVINKSWEETKLTLGKKKNRVSTGSMFTLAMAQPNRLEPD